MESGSVGAPVVSHVDRGRRLGDLSSLISSGGLLDRSGRLGDLSGFIRSLVLGLSDSLLHFEGSVSSSLSLSKDSRLVHSGLLDGFSNGVSEVLHISDFLGFNFSGGDV